MTNSLNTYQRSVRIGMRHSSLSDRGSGLSFYKKAAAGVTQVINENQPQVTWNWRAETTDGQVSWFDSQERTNAWLNKIDPHRKQDQWWRQADSLGEGHGNSNILAEVGSDDDETTQPDKSNDSRETSRLFKDKLIRDDGGRDSVEDLQEKDYGNDVLLDRYHTRQLDPERSLR